MLNLEIKGTIWEMKEGKTTAIKIDEQIFRLGTPVVSPQKVFLNTKETYLCKWIRKNNIQMFTPEDFYKAYPKQKDRKRHVDWYISELITENKLLQIGKDRFKVTENMYDE